MQGFNALNGSEVPGALKSGLTYYQVWNSSDWILNNGPQGLQRLDYIINTAGQYGIKIILAFTNNWVGYGGSELYVNWIAGSGKTHDVFYFDPKIIASYQRYVKTIVNRYKSSPNIFAWELMNEARCLGDLPGGPNCAPGTSLLSHWYKQQSDFVRSLDPFHMITTGGEGHFFSKDKNVGYWFNGTFISDYNFNGQAGEDFDADLQLDNIDFVLISQQHLYPQFWYPQLVINTLSNSSWTSLTCPQQDTPNSNFTIKDWGLLWIQMHADSAKKANKPLILEEFGVSGIRKYIYGQTALLLNFLLLSLENKTEIYPEWVNLALKTQHAILPWQFGTLGLKENGGNRLIKYADEIINGASPNDGFAYYKNQTIVWHIFKNAAKVQASRSK
ncbi:hypothetical protein CVT25_010212 [Psilocybe cyanescens]|uniref:mannan endo-1,4-beta-mannosidase n=1 Tax=Psilocybe cyanescens TaxID=93625 RepID=A0A409XD10_PSICY|nr:hypothetical protein CVT25_010212 [Psilocybe cyanescens]